MPRAAAHALATAGAVTAGMTALASAQAPPPTSAPAVSASPAPAPAGATPAPSPSAAASPTPTASPTPRPLYNYVYRPPQAGAAPLPEPGGPQIAEIDLSQIAFVPPSDIHVRVVTNGPTTSVVASTLGRTVQLQRTGDGIFAIDANIPAIPFWLGYLRNRTYPITFVASVPDGRSTQVVLALTLR